MLKRIFLLVSHGAVFVAGIALGIYILPILTASEGPDDAQVEALGTRALYRAPIPDEVRGHDLLHWGKGEFYISERTISLRGSVAPGPNYKLYLVKQQVETKEEFLRVRSQAALLGDVGSFDNFIVQVPPEIDVKRYTTVLVWCESFDAFITSAHYR
ncbi:MAG: hypothetical protein GKR94_07415 [Gammaproteobacteria bacterium]|nr:hypothetical protein [Gammaproteobacteria bacterium]